MFRRGNFSISNLRIEKITLKSKISSLDSESKTRDVNIAYYFCVGTRRNERFPRLPADCRLDKTRSDKITFYPSERDYVSLTKVESTFSFPIITILLQTYDRLQKYMRRVASGVLCAKTRPI